MALVLLTEVNPYEALGSVLRRMSYLLIPLSLLFMRFYPELGRAYHMGQPMFTGVATHKNTLGQICLVTGIYFCWEVLLYERKMTKSVKKMMRPIYVIMLPMIFWVLYRADSATSLGCMIMALCILVISRKFSVVKKPKYLQMIAIFLILIFVLVDFSFNISR